MAYCIGTTVKKLIIALSYEEYKIYQYERCNNSYSIIFSILKEISIFLQLVMIKSFKYVGNKFPRVKSGIFKVENKSFKNIYN